MLLPGVVLAEEKEGPMKRLAVWVTLTAAACTSVATGVDETILVYEVAAETVTCQGEAVQQCLQVRAPGTDAWLLFYDPIEGFQHEDGVSYTLEVARRNVPNPPADGSSFAYRLLRVIDRDPPA